MLLDKEWLVGVRKGWMKLLKELPYEDKSDISKAIEIEKVFVKNLDQQLKFVHRGAFVELSKKYESLLSDLFLEIDRANGKGHSAHLLAEHFHEMYQQKAQQYYPGQTIELTEAELEGVWTPEQYSAAIKTKYPKLAEALEKKEKHELLAQRFLKDEYPQQKKILMKVFDKLIKFLAAETEKLVDANPEWFQEAETEFDLHGVKVLIRDPELLPVDVKNYIKNFDQAYQMMVAKGYGKLWRGMIEVWCKTCGGENPNGKEWGVGGSYAYNKDKIWVYSRPSRGLPELIVHEMAHRFWFKHMSSTQRQKFEAWIESGAVKAVSAYGATKPSEAFAEVMAYFITGQKMDQDQQESFESVIKSARRVAGRYLTVVSRGTSMSFRTEVIKLAKSNPDLRKHLVPILAKTAVHTRFKIQDPHEMESEDAIRLAEMLMNAVDEVISEKLGIAQDELKHAQYELKTIQRDEQYLREQDFRMLLVEGYLEPDQREFLEIVMDIYGWSPRPY